ncbi:MAG: hypothetical protein WC719_00680 [Patescibacteria group bacterium]|jgi:hypothetical protein
MAQINLFFLRQGYYECIITTKETISTPYNRKITVELAGNKVWEKGTMVSSHSAIAIPKQLLPKMTDDNFLFIDCRKWENNDQPEVYLALEKKFTDGGEYYSRNLTETINDSPCNSFFFPAYLLKFKRGTVPKNQIIGHAHSLGLCNEPSPQEADCCLIKNGWIMFGEKGCSLWDNPEYTEITEEEFMKLANYFPRQEEIKNA